MSDDIDITMQDAYSANRVRIEPAEPGEAGVIRLINREGEEVLLIQLNGDIFVGGKKIAEDEHFVIAEALLGWAREVRTPDWIWELLCKGCRSNIGSHEAMRRLGAEEDEGGSDA